MQALAAIATASILTFCAIGAQAQDEQRRAQAEQTIKRIESTLQQRPNDGLLHFYMAMFQAQAGHRDASLEWLRKVAARRMGFVPTEGGGFDDIWNDEGFQALRREMKAGEPAVADAREVFRLPRATFIPEGIAYDPNGKRHLIGSIAERRIVQRSRSGKFSDFSSPQDGLKSVLGLRVDEKRKLLYAISGNGFSTREDEALETALFVYDLQTQKLRARYYAPEAVNLNDVAVGPGGEVLVTDSGSGVVYRLDEAAGDLVYQVPPGALSGCNGIVFAPDGKRAYVAISTGIAAIDLASGEVARLTQSDDLATGAIDGLYLYDGDLIGVQNFVNPGRVLRLHLDPAGKAIESMNVLQSNHPLLDEPTTGAIVGKYLHVIANSSVVRVQPDGSLRDEASLVPAAILAVPLSRPTKKP
jgi:sugar lactone lactonase YvrE